MSLGRLMMLGTLLSLIYPATAPAAAEDAQRPNILFIFSDDLTCQAIRAYGEKRHLLDTPNMGPCMASGVIRKTTKGFEIVHYQLSMAVPNEVAGQVTKLIAGQK